MFQKNDKALLTARTIIMVIIGITAVISLAIGIILAVLAHPAMILLTFVGWFFCWVAWVFARLYLSYLCDVKLIRNKLYGVSNEDLEMFLKDEEEIDAETEPSDDDQANNSELEQLNQLLESGEISDEEYSKRKSELTQEE